MQLRVSTAAQPCLQVSAAHFRVGGREILKPLLWLAHMDDFKKQLQSHQLSTFWMPSLFFLLARPRIFSMHARPGVLVRQQIVTSMSST